MIRDGLITEAGQDKAGGPERTRYELTDRGRADLAGWLGQVEEPAPFVQSTLFTKVVVALLAYDETTARRYLAAQRSAHLARMRADRRQGRFRRQCRGRGRRRLRTGPPRCRSALDADHARPRGGT